MVRIGLALTGVAAVLSLGPTLLVGGRGTGIPLPWAFFENLPLLPSLIPARLAQLTALFAFFTSPVDHLARISTGTPPPRLTGPKGRALARDLVRWRVGSVVVGPMQTRRPWSAS